MSKKLTGKALEQFEAERDVWQEVLDGVREIKGSDGKRKQVQAMERFKQDLLESVKQMRRGEVARVTRAKIPATKGGSRRS